METTSVLLSDEAALEETPELKKTFSIRCREIQPLNNQNKINLETLNSDQLDGVLLRLCVFFFFFQLSRAA